MRCLTLAETLRAEGAEVIFICRDLEGHLGDVIRERGFQCVLLEREGSPPARPGYAEDLPAHADWLCADWLADAEQSSDVVSGVDLLVVDHYALDYRWEQHLKPQVGAILAIDDLADRRHDADILLDSGFGRTPADYGVFTPPTCRMLTGTDYVPLGPRYRALRSSVLARRAQPAERRHVLVFLGGGDTLWAWNALLTAMSEIDMHAVDTITFVLGSAFRADPSLAARIERLPCQTRCVAFTDDFSELVASADIAIGGGGTTTWERCALGLPSLILIMADNQAPASLKLKEIGAIFDALAPDAVGPGPLSAFVDMPEAERMRMSSMAASICDGEGVDRILHAIEAQFSVAGSQ